jgi:site-specific DNA-methyltransferase (adenine-specific)
MMERNTIQHIEFFELCEQMPDESVDMILCDLPYGTTACSWDSIIPMEPMWQAFKRIIKPRGAIVLTATEPFASRLRMSNLDMYKYDWVWDKVTARGLQIAKYRPMQQHEQVLCFAINSPSYYPIMVKRVKPVKGKIYGMSNTFQIKNNDGVIRTYNEKYPKSILKFQGANIGYLHPTQKPVSLFEYLIKTYTQAGELVFDPCVGSGTTAVAARNTGRDYICGDFTREYVDMARERVRNSDPFKASIDKKTGVKQLSLFENITGVS